MGRAKGDGAEGRASAQARWGGPSAVRRLGSCRGANLGGQRRWRGNIRASGALAEQTLDRGDLKRGGPRNPLRNLW